MFVPRPKLFRLTGLSRFYLGDEPICLAQPLFKSANMSALAASAPWLRELHELFVACRPTIGSPKRTHWPSTDEHFFLDDDLDKGLKQSKECVTQFVQQVRYPAKEAFREQLKKAGGIVPDLAGLGTEDLDFLHDVSELLYYANAEKDVVRRIGSEVYDSGGFSAMQKVFYAFVHGFPAVGDAVWIRVYIKANIEWGWDGVGPWRA